jgi:hypothetical protein
MGGAEVDGEGGVHRGRRGHGEGERVVWFCPKFEGVRPLFLFSADPIPHEDLGPRLFRLSPDSATNARALRETPCKSHAFPTRPGSWRKVLRVKCDPVLSRAIMAMGYKWASHGAQRCTVRVRLLSGSWRSRVRSWFVNGRTEWPARRSQVDALILRL